MNMEKHYYIDRHIVSILFQEKDEAKALFLYNQISETINDVTEKILTDVLKKEGASKADIAMIFNPDVDPEEMKLEKPELLESLNDEETRKTILTASDAILKTVYDAQTPSLSDEENKKLNQYIKDQQLVDDYSRLSSIRGLEAIIANAEDEKRASEKPQEPVTPESTPEEAPAPDKPVTPQPKTPTPTPHPAVPSAANPNPGAAKSGAIKQNRNINIVDQALPRDTSLEDDFAPKLNLGGNKGSQPVTPTQN